MTALHAARPAYLAGKIRAMAGFLLALNGVVWVWAFLSFKDHPLLLGTAMLAYAYGLRHAVDADHIAAIDNVTRKLMQEGKWPISVGLFFSLGHSTVVVALSVLLALTTVQVQERFGDLKAVGEVVGTSASILFMFAIAAANIVVLRQTWKTYKNADGAADPMHLSQMMVGGGLFSRLLRRLYRLIDHGWQIYALGLLFGLGFETATEVGLLGISATSASNGLSPWTIMIFPALFSAGMALIDTADGILMLGAYGWAFIKPVRKLYYNLTITSLSVLVAVLVGGVEALGLLKEQFHWDGQGWQIVVMLNDHFGMMGYAIIGMFALGWVGSLILDRVKSSLRS